MTPARARDTATQLGVSTFVREVHGELDAALRDLFDVPEAVPMAWTAVGDEGLERVVVEVGGFSLELMLDAPGAVRSTTWNLRARRLNGAGSTDVLAALVRRFRAREPRVGASLLALAERSFRFRDIGDHAYRDITPSAAGSRAIVRLGFGCNQDCGFCWQGRDWPAPPPERYAQWIHELAAAGARDLVFSGGEPTLHKGLPELIRLARDLQLVPSLQTNAIRLRTPKYLRALRDAGLDELFVSLHAGNAELSDTLTRARGTFVNTLRGIDAALDDGMTVILNAVVEQRNHDRLVEHAQLIVDRFAHRPTPVRQVQYSQPSQYRTPALRSLGLVSMDAVRPHLTAAVRILLDADITAVVAGTCAFPPCLFADDPDLVQALAADAYGGMDASSRSYADTCDDCALKSGCLGVRREYLDAFGSAGLRPFASAPGDAPEARPSLKPLVD